MDMQLLRKTILIAYPMAKEVLVCEKAKKKIIIIK
jgi:hypothetical protein